VIEAELIHAGITTPEMLIENGSKKAFAKIKKYDKNACVSMLCALEGAIEGVRWYNLPTKTKEELKKFYNTL
jgi:DNA transformation protein